MCVASWILSFPFCLQNIAARIAFVYALFKPVGHASHCMKCSRIIQALNLPTWYNFFGRTYKTCMPTTEILVSEVIIGDASMFETRNLPQSNLIIPSSGSFQLIMENNCAVAYTISPIFKHTIDCVQLYFTNRSTNIVL